MSRPLLLLAVLSAAASGGCASLHAPAAPNPVFVPANHPELAWERTVDAIHDFKFPIARESKLDGVIETDYVVGSGVFEPWNRDSVGIDNRLESTFQSIRRRALVRLTPAPGGYYVAVEAYKEQEDVRGPVANTAGGASFQVNQPLQRDLNLVVGQAAPSGWILLGRDPALERAMLARIRSRF
ncbi:MAG TPA: hypothetical protein VF170_16415 [Planctomycetaceae bacterium]